MTIAVGFAYDDGLVFCVDTKISTNIKTNESKLEFRRSDDGLCCMAFAMSSDDLNFPRAAVSACWEMVRQMDFKTSTIEAIRNTAQFALAEFHREHIYPHPDRAPGAMYLQILAGVWIRGETGLFLTHDTLLVPVDVYECIGSGAYLARYLIRQYRQANGFPMTLEDAALMATFAVESAIDYDEGCGGEAEILIMRRSGEMGNAYSTAAYPSPRFVNALLGETWRFLHDVSQIKGDQDIESTPHLEAYFERIRQVNASHTWVPDSQRGLRKKIWFPDSED